MRRTDWARSLAMGGIGLLSLALCGCPGGTQESKASPKNASASKAQVEPEPATSMPPKLPVAEFQEPPAVPKSEPLPKPAMEEKTLPKREPSRAVAKEQPLPPAKPVESDTSNPLREGDDAVEKRSSSSTSEKTAETPVASGQKSPPPGRPNTGKNSGVPFDPIKENGSIFVGWTKPKVALIISGMERGYIEPCGCAGLDRMKGGMGRRASLFQELRDKGWPVLGLDVGGLVHGFGRQAELKYQTAVEGKRKAGYDAIAFGADDLRLPAGELVAVAAGVDGKPSPFVAANVGLLGHPGDITPQSRVLEVGGIKIGVTAVLGREYQKDIHNDEVEMLDPVAALEKIVPELKTKCDYLVLLAHATKDEAEALGKRFPEFNIVVTSAVPPEEPPSDYETIPGTKTPLITVGYKGMNAIVLGLYDDAEKPWRYQRVPLDSRFPASADMKMLMAAYQEQLKSIGFDGLGLRPVPHPLGETNGRFVGSKKCATCHEKSYDIWKKTLHSHAYETLAKLDPPRNFDPECVSCHVVGWNPGKFFPYASGYESLKKTPELLNVGCEDCHGPGEKHIAAESGGNTALQEKLRKAMVVTKAEAKKQQCYTCHDIDNSPDFNFDKYWPFVEHYEKESE